MRWETPERVVSWGVDVLGMGIREGTALYCTDEGVVLVERPAMRGAEACVTHAKWAEVASVLYRANAGWSHGDPYGMFGDNDEDWDVPASAWVTLWTPPIDINVSDEDAPSLASYARKLSGEA